MSRLISSVLEAKEPDFSHFIEEWERRAGRPGVDVRLTGELSAATKDTIRLLGLDSSDTTNEELYHALFKRAQQDNLNLEKHLSISSSDTPHAMAEKVIRFARTLAGSREVWVLKHSVCRKILKINPPKKLLRSLGYRSIDSVLKREHPATLMALADKADPAFKKRLITEYKKLIPADFDLRKIDINLLPAHKLAKLRGSDCIVDDLVLPVYETGALVIVPAPERRNNDTLLLLAVLLEGLRVIIMHSAYFKTLSTRAKFGQQFSIAANAGLATSSKSMVTTGWPSLHELVNKQPHKFPENLQPHVQPEDMIVPSIGTLSHEIPELLFWEQHKHIIRPDTSGIVSYNLLDVLINDLNDLPYKNNVSWYGHQQLWDILFARYLAHEPINNIVVKLD